MRTYYPNDFSEFIGNEEVITVVKRILSVAKTTAVVPFFSFRNSTGVGVSHLKRLIKEEEDKFGLNHAGNVTLDMKKIPFIKVAGFYSDVDLDYLEGLYFMLGFDFDALNEFFSTGKFKQYDESIFKKPIIFEQLIRSSNVEDLENRIIPTLEQFFDGDFFSFLSRFGEYIGSVRLMAFKAVTADSIDILFLGDVERSLIKFMSMNKFDFSFKFGVLTFINSFLTKEVD